MYSNQYVARILEEIRDALSILDEEPFRIRSYQLAALRVQNLSEPVGDVLARGDKIPGIGSGLEAKIREILQTGTCSTREALRREVPDSALALLKIPGCGPKTVAHLVFECGIDSLEKLEEALKRNPEQLGLTPKMIEKLKVGLPLAKEVPSRFSLGYVLKVLDDIASTLRKECTIEQLTYAGSVRRFRPMVRDADILVVAPEHEIPKIMNTFTTHPVVYAVQGEGTTKASIRTQEGLQVDLRIVPKESYGAAVNYFTGSKQFNIKLRTLAQQLNPPLFINEYGYFEGSANGRRLGGEREEELFDLLGIQYIVPELREDTGEVELAQQFSLPKLLEHTEIRGDTHVHSKWSDGTSSLAEVARYGEELGYEWVIVCDHSKGLGVAGGLSEEELQRRNIEIDSINNSGTFRCRLLKGIEVEVRKDGSLDLSNEVLAECDYVIAAVHSGLDNPAEALARTLRAIEHPLVHAIAHPTGRQFGRRDEGPLAPQFEQIVQAAAKHGKILELNCDPGRLDLDEVWARKAASNGVTIAIGTDAHYLPEQLYHMKLGVGLARRGWLRASDVLNSLSLQTLLYRLRKGAGQNR